MSRRNRRKKYIKKTSPKAQAARIARGRRTIIFAAIAIIGIIALVVILFIKGEHDKKDSLKLFTDKAEIIKSEALTDEFREAIELDTDNAVFFSVSDGTERAKVYVGIGSDLDSAWQNAIDEAGKFIYENTYNPLWVKADVLCSAEPADYSIFSSFDSDRENYFRYGLAFNGDLKTALLEEELNTYSIYDYSEKCINLENLNHYLNLTGKDTYSSLPTDIMTLNCRGWFCGEGNVVYELGSDGYSKGRRIIDPIDGNYAKQLVLDSSDFLANQLKDDGSFIYGYHPRFDRTLTSYNILRHSGSIWSLVIRYKMTGDESLIPKIESAIDYAVNNAAVYSDNDTAYLIEAKNGEIKLGGAGIFIVALTEYMEALNTDKYLDIAEKLGNGILAMLDTESGCYTHVLNSDFSVKEEFRTVYYDGEATFALCRLYGMTKDSKWLDAAKSAVNHFIEADYTQYRDHWIAYAMNEITMYTDDPDYYTFALRNAQVNLERLYNRDRTAPTNLELLMATFELYDRMIANGISVPYLQNGFDLEFFLKTLYSRVDNQLNGYFYPELAMYMDNPQRILNSFMVREDNFRVRIDDTQHNVGGYYLYWLNYDKLVEYGLTECSDLNEG